MCECVRLCTRAYVSVCVWEREIVSVCGFVSVCVREREGGLNVFNWGMVTRPQCAIERQKGLFEWRSFFTKKIRTKMRKIKERKCFSHWQRRCYASQFHDADKRETKYLFWNFVLFWFCIFSIVLFLNAKLMIKVISIDFLMFSLS